MFWLYSSFSPLHNLFSLSLSFFFINHYLRNYISFPFHFFLFYLFVSILRIVLLFFSSFSHYFHVLQAFFLLNYSIINNLLPICPFVELMPQMVHQLRLSNFRMLPSNSPIHPLDPFTYWIIFRSNYWGLVGFCGSKCILNTSNQLHLLPILLVLLHFSFN